MYPLTKPLRVMYLDVGDGHRLYLEESGSANGIPVIFLHGGPGAGCSPYHRCFFDPEKYAFIFFVFFEKGFLLYRCIKKGEPNEDPEK